MYEQNIVFSFSKVMTTQVHGQNDVAILMIRFCILFIHPQNEIQHSYYGFTIATEMALFFQNASIG